MIWSLRVGGGAGAVEFFSYKHSDGTALWERPGVADELTASASVCHLPNANTLKRKGGGLGDLPDI